MRIATLLFLAALVTASFPAVTGADESPRSGALTGFECENLCPLAHQANGMRALGAEALAVGSRVHGDLVLAVRKNLGRI